MDDDSQHQENHGLLSVIVGGNSDIDHETGDEIELPERTRHYDYM